MYGDGPTPGMHATDEPSAVSGELERLPEFDLSYLLDDGESPGAVTVYDPDAPDAGWISVDISGAVPVDEIR